MKRARRWERGLAPDRRSFKRASSLLPLVRAAVTGANGFIGRNLVKRLRERGHEVLSIIRRVEKAKMLEDLGSEVRVLRLEQVEELAASLREVDTLFHLANVMVYATKGQRWRSNVLDTRHVLQAAREAGVDQLVYASSVAVYGDTAGRRATEEDPTQPTTHYGWTKVQVEGLIRQEAGEMGRHILRLGLVYGPGSPLLYHLVRRGLALYGRGSNWVPLVHVVDVVRALTVTVGSERPDSLFNVVDDGPLRLREFLTIIARESGKNLRRRSYAATILIASAAEAAAHIKGTAPRLTRDALRLFRTSVRASNERIKEELGLRFLHPDPMVAVPDALRRVSETFAL